MRRILDPHPSFVLARALGLAAALGFAAGCGEGGAGGGDRTSGGTSGGETGGASSTGGAAPTSGGTGGAETTGGAPTTGGDSTTGGIDAAGGATGTGGVVDPAGGTSSGGVSPTGGAGSGGLPTGGVAAGGATGGGGTTGGDGSGGVATGGAVSGGAGGSGGPGGGALGGAGGEPIGGSAGAPPTGGSAGLDPVTWPLINGVQWADTEGNPIQAHGGGLLKVGEDYYWFGENRNPDGTFLAVSAYRSRDLRRWEHVNDVLRMTSDPDLNPANVERPKVVFNAATGKYVMWMHWENGRDYGEARAAVASSDDVAGDYTYHGSFRPLQDSGVSDHGKPGYMSRDCTLFVDDDGRGYFLSASNENRDLHLYLLSDDYLSIVRREALLFEGGVREAPALFKRDGVYFLVTSGATGWSPNQARYATSSSLASGWSSLQNVGDSNTFYSQPTYVLEIAGSEGTQYLYLGDRWAGAWGGPVNDSAYVWLPIAFSGPTTMSLGWANTVDLDVPAGRVTGAVNTFTFVNRASGLVLAVDGSPSEDGADIVQQPRDAASGDVWRFNYDGAGYFRLTNEAGGKVLDVPDESTQPGVPLDLWGENGGDHQAWRLIDLGAGEYRIRNKRSGLYVGVTGASTAAGAAIEQQPLSTGDEQIWEIVVAE